MGGRKGEKMENGEWMEKERRKKKAHRPERKGNMEKKKKKETTLTHRPAKFIPVRSWIMHASGNIHHVGLPRFYIQ